MLLKVVPAETTPAPADVAADAAPEPTAEPTAEETAEGTGMGTAGEMRKLSECELTSHAVTAVGWHFHDLFFGWLVNFLPLAGRSHSRASGSYCLRFYRLCGPCPCATAMHMSHIIRPAPTQALASSNGL